MDTIMIIDDDFTSLAVCKALLSSKYEVIAVNSGVQAIGYLNSELLPDLILLDSEMPGMSGMELLKYMKGQEKTCHIPVIYATENTNLSTAEEGYTAGIADLIVKPVKPILLIKKVELLLQIKHLQQENQKLLETIEEMKLEKENL